METKKENKGEEEGFGCERKEMGTGDGEEGRRKWEKEEK
jgi:hypothetical protein